MKNLLLFAAVLTFSTQASGQGSFQNLNFETVNVPANSPPGFMAISNVMPGWSAYVGGVQITNVGYNGVSAGAALVTLVGTNPIGAASPALDGNYSATLDSGETGSGLVSAAIAQTGTIPGTARSIIFIANYSVNSLSVSFDGQLVPYFLLSTSLGYQTYGGDISAFAGQTGELRFTENVAPPNPEPVAYLDDIQFSSQSIPEPSTWALLALGGALLLRRRKTA